MDIDLFWERIKKLCKEKGFTQKELSTKAGGEPRMIESQIFKRIAPNVDEVYNIARLLDTTVEYLVTGEDSLGYKDKYENILSELESIVKKSKTQ